MIRLSAAVAAAALALAACEKKPGTPTPPPGNAGGGHSHGSGAVIALGSATIGGFEVIATRDEGAIAPGGEAAIDVDVKPAAGNTAKVAAVRFWIGTQDAKGSIKARAAIEDPAHPEAWHTHAEIPSPLPEGSALWVEVEDDKGVTAAGSFDLKAG